MRVGVRSRTHMRQREDAASYLLITRRIFIFQTLHLRAEIGLDK